MASLPVLCGYARTPFTPANKGQLARVRPDDMLAQLIKGILSKTTLDAALLEDFLVGCAFPEGEQGLNIARMAGLLAGLPVTVPGATVNRFCGSSMETAHIAAAKIMAGAGEAYLSAGVESMSRVPMGGFNPAPHPGLYGSMPQAYISMGLTAEHLAKKYGITRAAQEQFALESHQKASKADFSGEIIPVTAKAGTVERDGCIRADASLAAMQGLAPAFDASGTVTAATSSPVTDGAAAVLVTSESFADSHGLTKLARIRSQAVAGLLPEEMGLGPVYAGRKALERAGLELKDMDVLELNEAFAAQALAVIQELQLDVSRLNRDGGAIALGHPLGASGARVLGKAALRLQKEGGTHALAFLCIGGGQGIATVLERA